ncbi:hypothetical protein FRC03_001615 [Tulasnella sp. 419]|nr:hypothetical protein FRC03_001615 [Tulasnella sp. 419]
MKLSTLSNSALVALIMASHATATSRDRTFEFRNFVNNFFDGFGKVETKTVTVTATAYPHQFSQFDTNACVVPTKPASHNTGAQTVAVTTSARGNPVKGVHDGAATPVTQSQSASVTESVSKSLSHAQPIITTVTKVIEHEVPITVTVTEKGAVVTSVVTTLLSTELRTLTVDASQAVTSGVADATSSISSSSTTSDSDIATTSTSGATPCPTDPVTVTVTASSSITSGASNTDIPSSVTQATTSTSATEVIIESTTTSAPALSVKETVTATNDLATTTTTSTAPEATEDPQASRNLDKRVIQDALKTDGEPGVGEVPSLTSSNNFINFCMTQDVPLTNGQQVKTGSCNPTPMGRILAQNRLPSATFQFPKNFDTIPANTKFTILMKIRNLVSGNFVNAQANYYAAPAQVDATGTLVGHSHVVIQRMQAFDQRTPLDPLVFDFFKGLNAPAADGILSAEVTGGLPAGKYRIASINSAANHQPALSGIEQHGSMDAFSYFTVE